MLLRFYLIVGAVLSNLFGMDADAQDPTFSQYCYSPTTTNPALTGTGKTCGGRAAIAYRNQWPSLYRTYQTFAASYDRGMSSINGGFGVLMTYDISNILNTSTYYLQYAHPLKLTDSLKLRLGVQAGLVHKSIDWGGLSFSDMIEPRSGFIYPTNEPLPPPSITFPNFAAGALLHNHRFYAGFAAFNVFEPNQSFYKSTSPAAKLPIRFSVHGGYRCSLGSWQFTPVVLAMAQRQFLLVQAGLMANYKQLLTGVQMRLVRPGDIQPMAMAGYQGRRLTVCYGYDYSVSILGGAGGSHELMAVYNFRCKKSSNGSTFRFHQ